MSKAPQVVGDLREGDLLERIRQALGSVMPNSPRGMGDDAAILSEAEPVNLVTVDPVIAGRHFSRDDPAAAVGEKLVGRNLSDIAAMAGLPGGSVLTLAMPGEWPLAWLDPFLDGMREASRRWNLEINGGDVAETEGDFVATLTVWGYAARPLTRAGGRDGDGIAVTGALGGSRLGRHLRPIPRLREAQWLARDGGVHALIDVSDGLAKDLRALLGKRLCAKVSRAHVPIHEDAHALAAQTGRSPFAHAWTDGEDYELLMLVEAGTFPDLQERWAATMDLPLTAIGRVRETTSDNAGQVVEAETGEPLDEGGYEHFQPA